MQVTGTLDGKSKSAVHWPAITLFLAVLAACFLGILTRPVGFLASVWPANAVMLGILLRVPGAARWTGWLAGIAAFMVADLLTEATPIKAAILNTANLVSIGVAYAVLSRFPRDVVSLKQPQSILLVVLAVALGGAAAGVIGGFANPFLFDGSVLHGFMFWWVTEFVNYVAILPVVLAAPAWHHLRQAFAQRGWRVRRSDLLPTLAVLSSCLAALLMGGPGALAFPVLALLWCGLIYPVFPTAVLTLFSSLLALLFLFSDYFPSYNGNLDNLSLTSIRLGISAIAIAPIMLSIVIQNRNELLSRLRYMATHDPLTGLMSRAAFFEDIATLLARTKMAHAVMMIDLDHFKSINDTYGHGAGDDVLRVSAQCIKTCLRSQDRSGRLGGEEFAVFLHGCQPSEAQDVAERIRHAIARTPVALADGRKVQVTASIGVALIQVHNERNLNELLVDADGALYISKHKGRNRVETK